MTLDAYATFSAGTRVLFRYSGNLSEAERLGWDPAIARYHLHSGAVVRPLDNTERAIAWVGAMYVVRFDDGYEGDTFADELEAVR